MKPCAADSMLCPCLPFSPPARHPAAARHGRRGGQSLIESCIVMGMTCLLLLGIFQIARLFAAREVLDHAAARGARAKTVGFNWWMVEKCIRVAAIPNAGRMVEPIFVNQDQPLESEMKNAKNSGDLWTKLLGITPISAQYDIERARIPEYLGSVNYFQGQYLLDYSDWDTVKGNHGKSPSQPDGSIVPDPIIHVSVNQDFPFTVPMHRTFYDADFVKIHGDGYLENHYPLYIDDKNW